VVDHPTAVVDLLMLVLEAHPTAPMASHPRLLATEAPAMIAATIVRTTITADVIASPMTLMTAVAAAVVTVAAVAEAMVAAAAEAMVAEALVALVALVAIE